MFGKFSLGACAVALVASATVVDAATVGFQVRVGGGKNAPIIRLMNTSTEVGAEITEFKMTIGDTAYNFDYFWLKSSPTMSYTVLTPDLVNGGNRFDELHATFTDFGPSKWFRIKTDIDVDNVDGNKQNWHQVLYDFTGPYDISDNAEFHVTFSTGHQLEGYMKDYSVEKKRVRYGRNIELPSAPPVQPAAIPLPMAAWSGLSLLGGLGGLEMFRKGFFRTVFR